MKKKSISCVTLLFVWLGVIQCHAQNEFVSGYVVTPKGDTLSGFISDKIFKKRVETVLFKKHTTDRTPVAYQATDLTSVYVAATKEYFYGTRVDVDKKTDDVTKLETTPQPRYMKETVFLKALVRGRANLYYYLDENGKNHYFFQKEGGEIAELELVTYAINSVDFRVQEIYKQQLTDAFADCPKLNFRNLRFVEVALKDAVQQYNFCTTQQTGYVQKDTELKVVFGLNVGVASMMGQLSGVEIGGLSNPVESLDFTTSTNPSFGVSAQLYPGRASNPISICLEALVKKHSYTGAYDVPPDLHYTVGMAQTHYRLNVLFAYTFEGKIKPYIKAGGILGYVTNPTNIVSTARYSTEPFRELRNFEVGLAGGVGVLIGHFSVEARYESSQTSCSGKGIFSSNGLAAYVGYRFN